MKAIDAVLLDIDGTLIDSNLAHVMAWQDFLGQKGRWLPIGRISQIIGMGGDKVLAEIFDGKLDQKTVKSWSKERDEIYLSRYWAHVKPFPGVRDFLAAMHMRRLRVVVATSAGEMLLAEVKKMIPELDFFVDGYTNADDVEHSKPAPDIFLAGIKEYRLDPTRTVVIGDTPYDLEGAARVPCRSIAVMTGGFPYWTLAKAVEIWPGIQELGRSMNRSILSQ